MLSASALTSRDLLLQPRHPVGRILDVSDRLRPPGLHLRLYVRCDPCLGLGSGNRRTRGCCRIPRHIERFFFACRLGLEPQLLFGVAAERRVALAQQLAARDWHRPQAV